MAQAPVKIRSLTWSSKAVFPGQVANTAHRCLPVAEPNAKLLGQLGRYLAERRPLRDRCENGFVHNTFFIQFGGYIRVSQMA